MASADGSADENMGGGRQGGRDAATDGATNGGTDGNPGRGRVADRPAPDDAAGRQTGRLDKWLWQARFFRSRSLAAAAVGGGRLRVNAARVTKPAAAVGPGDTLTFVQGGRVRVIRILSLAGRRGPAAEARGLYEDLESGAPTGPPTGPPDARPGARSDTVGEALSDAPAHAPHNAPENAPENAPGDAPQTPPPPPAAKRSGGA